MNKIEITTHNQKQTNIVLNEMRKDPLQFSLPGDFLSNDNSIEVYTLEYKQGNVIEIFTNKYHKNVLAFLKRIKVYEFTEKSITYNVVKDKNIYIENLDEKNLVLVKNFLKTLNIPDLQSRPYFEEKDEE